jgi:phosphopantetheine adenylyltransferase
LVAVGKKSVEAYKAQAQADAKLEQALKNTAWAAGYTSGELKTMAAELQKVTGFSDEAIESAMAFVASTGKVRGDNFKRTAVAAVDMAAALRAAGDEEGNVESAAKMLAKALEDPEEGLSKLKRAGVQFTGAQEDQIKSMIKAGKTAEAQAVILAEVERRYKGTAEAMHAQNKGVNDLATSYDDLMEQVGGAITKSTGFQDIIKQLSAYIKSLTESGKLELWVNNIATAFSGLAKVAEIALVPFKAIAKVIDTAGAFVGGFAGASGQGFVGRIDAGTRAAQYAGSGRRDADELAAIKANAEAEKKAAEAKEAAAKKAAATVLAARDAEEEAAKRRKESADKEKESGEKRIELAKEALRIEKEIADEKEAIAEREKEMGQRDLDQRWEKALDEAEKLAEKSKTWLEKRKEMGAVGSAQFREALQAEAQRKRRAGKINAKRKSLGMAELDAAALEGMGNQELDMQEDSLKIQRNLGLMGGKADGTMRLGEAGQNPEKLAELAEKQGRRLTKRQQEVLTRNAAKMEEMRQKGAAALAAANIKAIADKADQEWKHKMLLANETSAGNLKDMVASLATVEGNLDTLLRAAH